MTEMDFIEWLLDAPTPTIRYLALRRLLGKAEDHPDVQSARRAMMSQGPVPAILERQTATGNWPNEHSYYTPKYTSTHWAMLLLAELHADGTDERVRRGAEFMLSATKTGLRWGDRGLSCFWGNLLRYVLHSGFAGDPRTERVEDYLVRDGLEYEWCCHINGGLPCAWGAARALWGLAAVRNPRPQTQTAIESGLALLVDRNDLLRAEYPTSGKRHALWDRLNFPLFYQADVLFILRVLGELGVLNRIGAQYALDWLTVRRLPNGRWRGSSPYRQRTYAAMGGVEETNRWVSLQAATVLALAFRDETAEWERSA
jgi:hypothetical protein